MLKKERIVIEQLQHKIGCYPRILQLKNNIKIAIIILQLLSACLLNLHIIKKHA